MARTYPAVFQAHALGLVHDLEARGVARAAGHAVLIIIVILIILGVLLGMGLSSFFRRRR